MQSPTGRSWSTDILSVCHTHQGWLHWVTHNDVCGSRCVSEVVVVQGYDKHTLRLYGLPYSVNRVRAAMFNAAIKWMPLALD